MMPGDCFVGWRGGVWFRRREVICSILPFWPYGGRWGTRTEMDRCSQLRLDVEISEKISPQQFSKNSILIAILNRFQRPFLNQMVSTSSIYQSFRIFIVLSHFKWASLIFALRPGLHTVPQTYLIVAGVEVVVIGKGEPHDHCLHFPKKSMKKTKINRWGV